MADATTQLFISKRLYSAGLQLMRMYYNPDKSSTIDITLSASDQILDLSKTAGDITQVVKFEFFTSATDTNPVDLSSSVWQAKGTIAGGPNVCFYVKGGGIGTSIAVGTSAFGYTYEVKDPSVIYYQPDNDSYMLTASRNISNYGYDNSATYPFGLDLIVAPTVTCNFDAQGGQPTPESQSGESPLSVVQPTTPSKTLSIFAGWFTQPTGGSKITFPYTVEGPDGYSETLYAQWQDISPAKGGYIIV